MSVNRRHFVATAASAPVLVHFATSQVAAQESGSGSAASSGSGAPSQVMPVQRLGLPDGTTVTAISDGYLSMSADNLSNISPEQVDELLHQAFRGSSPATAGLNAFVVETGDKVTLIDTGGGTGGAFPTAGNLAERLPQAGFRPEAITDVLMTHLHPDHVGGLVADGKIVFPNATVHVNQTEYDYWTSTENRDAAPESAQGAFDRARNAMETAGDAVKTFSGDGEVVPGVTSRELFGHTPGHTGFRIGDSENGLLVWGDIVHVAPVQFPRPDVGIGFDVNPEQAIETRRQIMREVADNRTLIAGMHITFPGFGHVRALSRNDGYEFVPAAWDYTVGSRSDSGNESGSASNGG